MIDGNSGIFFMEKLLYMLCKYLLILIVNKTPCGKLPEKKKKKSPKKIGEGWNVFFPITFNVTDFPHFLFKSLNVGSSNVKPFIYETWNFLLTVESWFFYCLKKKSNLARGFIHAKCLMNCTAPFKTSRLKIIAYFMGKWHRHIQIRKSNQNSS